MLHHAFHREVFPQLGFCKIETGGTNRINVVRKKGERRCVTLLWFYGFEENIGHSTEYINRVQRQREKSPQISNFSFDMPRWPFGLGASEDNREFNVVIYEEDYKELCAWVLRKPHIQTGGDLFGLWANKYSAVIQLVLGPGKGCRRTSTSFYQDVDYLEKVRMHLTQKEGICYIGEWHSHHQFGLARPSGEDENTVWNNMPTYNLTRFVIFIANIDHFGQSYSVNVGCFLFEIDSNGKQLPVLPGKLQILNQESPFSGKFEVKKFKRAGEKKRKGTSSRLISRI